MKIIESSKLKSAQQTLDSDLQVCEQHERTPKSYPPPRMQHLYLEYHSLDLESSASGEPNSSKTSLSFPPTYTNYPEGFELGKPNHHVVAAPLFELASVRIESNQFKGFNSIKIYGSIVLIDNHGNEFSIFDCKNRNDAKTLIIEPKETPCVILENFQPRGLPGKFCLLFQLKRRLDGAAKDDILIFNDYQYIDCTGEVQVLYDKPQVSVFNDDRSIIVVTYTIFQCALLAEVGIVVEQIGKHDESGVAAITGGIVAQTKGLSDDISPHVRTLAMSREKFHCGNYIPLPTLVVPAYSNLKLEGLLNVNGENLSCDLMFPPFTVDTIFLEKQIIGGAYQIRVIVYWFPGATSLMEAEILEYYAKASETPFTNRWPTSKILGTKKTYHIQPGVTQYLMDIDLDRDKCYFPTELLEIFSISVCAYDQGDYDQGDSVFSLRGKVKCFDCIGRLLIFDSDTGGVSTSGNTIKLVPDLGRGFISPHIRIETDLKDNQGREISFGYAIYGPHTIQGWYDQRICSVIRGQNGFAAVHYTIFSDAVLAKLSFEVVNNSEFGGATGCKVHGSINTSYSNFNYSTHYAKKYYRSTLFEKQESDAVKLAGGEKIPLSKSVVAVPVYGLLIVEAIVSVQNGKHREVFKFKETFSPAKPFHNIKKLGKRKSFDLNMNVECVQDIPL